MRLDRNKELTPVLYGKSAVKILRPVIFPENMLCFNMHWHERMELLYVVSGKIKLRLNNTETVVEPGSIAVIPPEKPHMAISAADNTGYYTIMFDVKSFYNTASASRGLLEPIAAKTVDFTPVTQDPEIISAVEIMLREEYGGDRSSPLIIISSIYLILGLLYRKCVSENTGIPGGERFKDIIEYISENYCDNISSHSLSRRFGYTEEYFCRQFKSVTGITPMNYINILRLEKSKKLIDNGETLVSRIYAEVGFSDMSYFARRFKKYFGITPGEYIKKLGAAALE